MRTQLNRAAIARLVTHEQVQQDVDRAGDFVVSEARRRAAKDTGAGAASIHAERQPDGSLRIGWDEEHDYMRFPEFGTEDMSPQPALRPAAHALGNATQ